jgi:hypothetical protein
MDFLELLVRILIGIFLLYGIIWNGHHIYENFHQKKWMETSTGLIALCIFMTLLVGVIYSWDTL